jgi:hypothetical protein
LTTSANRALLGEQAGGTARYNPYHQQERRPLMSEENVTRDETAGKPWNVYQKPTRSPDRDGAERIKHPAFGVVQVSRPSGGHTTLMGSDFRHNFCVRFTISEADQFRSLSNTWTFPGRQLLEFEMSEAQFAHMVSSPGVGGGTDVTLRWVAGKHIPRIEMDEHVTETFSRELSEDLQDSIAAIKTARAALDEGGNAKQRKAAQAALDKALRALTDSAPFVVKSFDEHMEGTVQKAKTEAHAALLQAVTRAGLDVLKLEDKRDE